MRDVTEFSVGDILKTSVAVYFNSLPAFLPLSVIAFAPAVVVVFFVDSSTLHNPYVLDRTGQILLDEAYWAFMLAGMRESFVGLVCTIWLQAGVAFGVVRHLRGGNPGFLETFVQSLRMLLPAALVTVVVALATFIGLLLLVVPGVIVALVLWVVVPAAVVERSGLRALGRSAQLTSGYKGQIFGLGLILFVVEAATLSVVLMALSALMTNAVLVNVVVQSCSVVLAGIWATAVSVTYHDLRILKEGAETGSVSRVFE